MRTSLTLALMLMAAMTFAQQPSPTDKPVTPLASPADQPNPDAKKAGAEPAKPKPISPEELWLYPAQRVSADLESQSWRMRHDLHAIGMATLGAAWWKQDRSAAEHWIYPAVDEVTVAPQDESDGEHERRVDAARRVLDIITPVDVNIRERLKDVLKSAAREENNGGSTARATADALVLAAQTAEPSQFARALSEALDYGVTPITVDGIRSLRQQLPDDAERLFARALEQASATQDSSELEAFAAVLASPANSDNPDPWRQQVSAAYTRALSDGSSMDQEQRCDLARSFVRPQTATELPQVLTAVSAQCMVGSDPALAADAQILQRSDPHTSQEYLAVAGQSKSPISRYTVKLTAAEKAEKEDLDSDNGGAVRALRIFDGMTAEERAVKPGEYRRLRAEEAIRAALFTVGKSSCSAGLRVVDTSPRETIFHVAVGVAEKVEPGCLPMVVEIARNQMRRTPPEDANDYIRFLNLMLRRRKTHDSYVVQEILRGMDEWKPKDRKALLLGDVVYEAPWNQLVPLNIDPELFNFGAEVLSAIARGSFRNDLLRLDFELYLVHGFLARYTREVASRRAEMADESGKP